MDFTTPIFLFFFLPLVLCAYWVSSKKIRLLLLLGASLFFYAWGEVFYVAVLVLAIGVNHLLTHLIHSSPQPSRRIAFLYGTVALNLAMLFAFKYPGMIQWLADKIGISFSGLTSLHLPLGISFFTFQAIAYAVDVYNEKHAPLLNPFRFSLFLSLFPKISAGPIIRYDEVEDALSGPTVTMDGCAYGAKRFIIGLGKKLIIADTLAVTANKIFEIPGGDLTAPLAWLGLICYTLQLYFDFAGYSDMAIGLGRMLGFSFRENFDYPYISKSLTEFWRRWHISLSTWFRDYVYTPLLYSLMTDKIRQKIARGQYRTNYRGMLCVVVVFTLCGWWHGATWNFIIWGLLHGLILAAESWKLGKLLKKIPAPLAHLYALLAISLCWVFFRSPTLGGAITFLTALFGFGSGPGTVYNISLYLNNELLLVLLVAILASMPSARFIRDRIIPKLPVFEANWSAGMLETVSVTAIFLISLLLAASSTYKPFIYFRF
ncbi:MBOAT family protein [Desulfuromonas sp. TF]|uniref:MBOAT family O-acyltransferase n=1 Tax=Desulfuromonas sp. TF TaxID=1232410 RepID=UPI0003FAF0E5|nr:MBOAT family O-acyltransferase [Desulfuromonas sp. TF]